VITLPADDGAEETRNLALAKLQQMRADRWINRQTRAVFVTINLFNPWSTGYITVVCLILEHPAAGVLYPSVSIWHVPLGSLFADYAKLSNLGPEIAHTIAVVFYMYWEFNQASMVSFVEYFSHFWGIYDWLNFSCSLWPARFGGPPMKELNYSPFHWQTKPLSNLKRQRFTSSCDAMCWH